MRLRTKLRLPKEHGAWAMLYVPFTLGALVGCSRASFSPLQLLLLLFSVTFAFIARQSILDWWLARSRGIAGVEARRMMLVYVILAGVFGAPVVFFYHRLWLVPVAILTAVLLAFNSWQGVRRKDRTIIGEAIAILGLTLTASSAYYVCAGEWDGNAWLLWALCILYFTSSLFYVKLRVHSLNRRREDLSRQSRLRCRLYHLFLVATLVILAARNNANLFVLVAFAPALLRTFRQLERPAARASLKQIGVLEIAYSVFFLVFVTIGLRGL